jgi:7-cyano-7-deazaguanine reductase
MKKIDRSYTEDHARAGQDAPLPDIECWENQYPGYEIELSFPEFTSVCPKTGLPDFGKLTLRYGPDKLCLETKSLKLYLTAYRNLGIFTENVVNRVLADVVKHAKPKWAVVEGLFAARGGIEAKITAAHGTQSAPTQSAGRNGHTSRNGKDA